MSRQNDDVASDINEENQNAVQYDWKFDSCGNKHRIIRVNITDDKSDKGPILGVGVAGVTCLAIRH